MIPASFALGTLSYQQANNEPRTLDRLRAIARHEAMRGFRFVP
jgi:hypothetical protein